MSNPFWRKVRLWGLISLLVSCNAMLGIMAWSKQWYWFAVFATIEATILIAELVSYLSLKKTISTQWGKWYQKQPIRAALALILFLWAMFSLGVHIAGYFFG